MFHPVYVPGLFKGFFFLSRARVTDSGLGLGLVFELRLGLDMVD